MNERSVKDVFCEAVERYAPEEWPDYLDQAHLDQTKRQRVETLLRAHLKENAVLDQRTDVGAEGPGTIVGNYRLLEEIGEGGFGIVFMADQFQPVRRKVAIKIIKPGMDTRQIVARFEAERQALAMMEHPNIARVFDAGVTDSGRSFFAMELVCGLPITSYCDRHKLSVNERLQLFACVCDAVQHAHQKGIIHRDLKPTNVLVALDDSQAMIKVIDFGVAKALNQQLTEATIYTSLGQMVGTPLYMSPEQSDLSGHDVDTRSDIYSLGVLMYELLTGTTPFDRQRLSTAAFDEVRRVLKEEEPQKPSTRITAMDKSLETVSSRRVTDSRKLSVLVRGDLDWITMKAMEKDRDRRYDSAKEIADDVQNFLSDKPIMARPPSAIYRTQKWMRRNRIVPRLGLAVGILLIATVVIAPKWYEARRIEWSTTEAARLHVLASQHRAKRDLGAAEKYYRQSLALRREWLDENDVGTLNTMYCLAEVLLWQEKFWDAIQLCESTYTRQMLVLGANHPETIRTAELFRVGCVAVAWNECLAVESGTTRDSDEALRLADRALELHVAIESSRMDYESEPGWLAKQGTSAIWWLKSWCHAVRGELEAYNDAVAKAPASLSGDRHLFKWLPQAVLYHRLGRKNLARSCFAVASDQLAVTLLTKNPVMSEFRLDMRNKTAALLGLSEAWLPENQNHSQLLHAYDKLIGEMGDDPALYYGRASLKARMGDWYAAVGDASKAVVQAPRDFRSWEMWALFSLQAGEVRSFQEICKGTFDQFEYGLSQSEMIRLCTLVPNGSVDPKDLLRLSEQIQHSPTDDRLACGMTYYRNGSYRQALETLPFDEQSVLGALASVFQAMSLFELGQTDAARQVLRQTREEIEQTVPSIDGPPLLYGSERPVIWVMLNTPLAEAEQLIGGLAKSFDASPTK